MDMARLHPLTLAFEAPALEAEYQRRRRPALRRRAAAAITAILVLYPLFGALDPWIMPEAYRAAWIIRGVVTAQCALLLGLTRARAFARLRPWLIASLPVLGGLGILAIIALGGEAGGQLYSAGLILAVIWTLLFSDLNFVPAVGLCLAMAGGYGALALGLRPVWALAAVCNLAFLLGALVMAALARYTLERQTRQGFQQTLVIERERQRADTLLHNVLPAEISETLKSPARVSTRRHAAASVLMADIVGFTTLTARLEPEALIGLLEQVYSAFDALVAKHGLEKIRTVGDGYLAAAGVQHPRPDHAAALAALALDMAAYAATVTTPLGRPLQLRLGLSSGPLAAGVIGRMRYQYDLWGDTVNIASRMESHGVPGRIQVSAAAAALLRDEFILEQRGVIEVKGLGPMETWFLVGRAAVAADVVADVADAGGGDGAGSPHRLRSGTMWGD